jgi:hypothetical protein
MAETLKQVGKTKIVVLIVQTDLCMSLQSKQLKSTFCSLELNKLIARTPT